MKIYGLQKLTLLDYPGKVACTVFTGGCNFRCPFCHNAPLVIPERNNYELYPDELLDYLKKRREILDGVVITGGEPLLNPDIIEIMQKIKDLGYMIKLDTNGSFPDLLKRIVSDGLADYVAMDIKNSPDEYANATGLDFFDITPVEQSKMYLMSGAVEYEFRTTVVKGIHTKESIAGIAKWLIGANKYFLQQYKDSGDLIKSDGLSPYDEEEMKKFADIVRPFVPAVQIRGL